MRIKTQTTDRGKKYLQSVYLIWNLHPGYIKESYDSIKNTNNKRKKKINISPSRETVGSSLEELRF